MFFRILKGPVLGHAQGSVAYHHNSLELLTLVQGPERNIRETHSHPARKSIEKQVCSFIKAVFLSFIGFKRFLVLRGIFHTTSGSVLHSQIAVSTSRTLEKPRCSSFLQLPCTRVDRPFLRCCPRLSPHTFFCLESMSSLHQFGECTSWETRKFNIWKSETWENVHRLIIEIGLTKSFSTSVSQ